MGASQIGAKRLMRQSFAAHFHTDQGQFLQEHQVDPAPIGRALWRVVVLFAMVFIGLQWAWGEARGTAVERAVIDAATVGTAVAIINTLTPDVQASALGPRIKAPGGGINILNGCEGTEVLILLFAALIAYPLSWPTRAAGLFGGTVFVFAINQIRLLALFYSYQNDRALFDQLHGLVMPLALIVATLGLFIWILYLDERYGHTPSKARHT